MTILQKVKHFFNPYAKSPSAWDDYWYTVPFGMAPETKSGARIDETTAMNLNGVWACINPISQDVGSLPLHLYQTLDNGSKEKAETHPLYRLLHDTPNPEMTAFTFRQTLMAHVLTWGNGYAEIERNQGNAIRALWPLPPNRVTVKRSRDNELYYEYRPDKGEPKNIPKNFMLHLKGLSNNGVVGYSPILKLRESIGLAAASEEYAARYFGQGTNVGLILKHPGKLSPEAAEHLRDSLTKAYSGLGKSHRLMVLQESMDFAKIGVDPEAAQLLGTRQFQLAEIARIYRIPLHMIAGDVERAKGWSTLEQQSIEYVKFCLRPWLENFEQEYKRQLQVQTRFYWKHSVEGLLRADTKARTEYYREGRNGGWLNADEIRELEDRNPLPAGKGKIYWQPANMNELGKEPEPAPAPPQTADPQKGNGQDGDWQVKPENRCLNCGKLLFKGAGELEIMCPKCGAVNIYTKETSTQAYIAA